MEEKLWNIFKNVNSWLEFSEKKNTYLLTFVGLQLTIIKICSLQMDGWLIVCVVLLLMSLMLCILSFFPVTKMIDYIYKFSNRSKKPQDNDNLLFYSDIAKYNGDEYIAAIEKYFGNSVKESRYLSDLCNQIVANASIAAEKLEIFKLNFWLLIGAEFCFIGSLLL